MRVLNRGSLLARRGAGRERRFLGPEGEEHVFLLRSSVTVVAKRG